MKRILSTSLVALPILAALPVHAALFSDFEVPAFRGQPNSESAYWDVFTVPVGAPGNAANGVASGGVDLSGAIITQTTPGAFLTGGGNIYSFSSANTFILEDEVDYAAGLGLVVLQVNTLGTLLDYESVALTYDLGSGPITVTTTREELYNSPGLGNDIVNKWEWNLSGLGVNSYSIAFNATESSLSLDKVTLDTLSAVPEPQEYAAMVGVALSGFALWRRSRKKS